VAGAPPWRIVLAAVIGGALVSPMVNIIAKEAKGHGVPEIMEAVALKGGRIRPRVSLVKAVASAISIGTGGSVGREGPIAQIGAALGSTLGGFLRVSSQRMRLLVACGASAGIAATFNAPIAGVMFSVEVILGAFSIHTLSSLVMSSVLATIVSHLYLSDAPAFVIPSHALISPWEVGSYLLLGLVTGAVSAVYIMLVYAMEDVFEKLPIPTLTKTSLGMGLLGVLLIYFPRVFGNGYQTIEACLGYEVNLGLGFLVVLLAVKLLATTLTLGSGASGGIFAPSLFIGAVSGAAFGKLVHGLAPDLTAGPGAYALAGMAGLVAGACHAPITAILMLFELTVDYKLILPIMLVAITASSVAKSLHRDSIYTEKLSRRGINLHQGIEASIMSDSLVEDLMHVDVPTLSPEMSFSQLLNRVLNTEGDQCHVVDEEGRFLGLLHTQDVLAAASAPSKRMPGSVREIMVTRVQGIEPDRTLLDCMIMMNRSGLQELPVVDGEGKLLGIIKAGDIIALYNREVLRQGTLGLRFVSREPLQRREDYVTVPEGYRVQLLHVSPQMSGKTLGELDLRKRFNVNIVAIRSPQGAAGCSEMPDPNRKLDVQDLLVVVGRDEDLRSFIEHYQIPA